MVDSSGDIRALGRTMSPMVVPRPGRRWATRVGLPIALVGVVVALLALSARDALMPAVDVHVVPVVARPRALDAADSNDPAHRASAEPVVIAQAPGWIEPDPFAVIVPATIDGVVKDVLVLEGDRVEAGQPVARLTSEDADLMVLAAEAAAAEREADVAHARATLDSARATVQVERSVADELRDEYERKGELADEGFVSTGEYRRMGIRLAGLDSRVGRAESDARVAEASLARAQAGAQAAQVALAQARLQQSRTLITAPVAGVVLERLVEPGSRLSMSAQAMDGFAPAAVARLYDPDRLQVRADVPLADAARIGVGMRAEISTEALPGETFAGEVVRIMHEADLQRNTVQFKVAIRNPKPALRPQMLTRVRFLREGDGRAGAAGGGAEAAPFDLVLPRAALLDADADQARVWLAAEPDSASRAFAELRDVAWRAGAEADEALVTSGLLPGDRVILDAPPGLAPGARIHIVGEHESLEFTSE